MKYALSACIILIAGPSFAQFATELQAIALVETSNGKNLKHALVTRGPHKGTRAGGFYGMMPRTAKELIVGSRRLSEKYGHWVYASDDDLTEELNSNREMDRDIATYMWRGLRRTMSADRAACSWFWGPSHSRCAGEDHGDAEYVQRFRRFLSAQ